ncbi:MAG: hypothetical protein ACYC3I_24865 [Gemmataceae bacterium]
MLIFAEHKPLSAKDRQWLVERCRLWAAKLDKLREEVETGRNAVEVRGEADKTIEKLIAASRTVRGRWALAKEPRKHYASALDLSEARDSCAAGWQGTGAQSLLG